MDHVYTGKRERVIERSCGEVGMSKKIAIVSLGYLWFPCESGPSRFYDIAMHFVEAGYDVECITTSFQHFKKSPRNKKLILEQGYPFKITFIDAPSYKKNVDVRRIISNKVAAGNLKRYLIKNINQYDAVYVAIPANNISAMVTSICKKNEIPVVVDIEDLWPEAMSMVIKNRVVRKVLLYSFERDAEITYKNANGIIGTSEDYTDRAFKKRKRNIPAETVYVGCNLAEFDAGVEKYSDEIVKGEGHFWVTYTGSISTSYDIKTLIDAGYALKDKNVHVQILGTGSLKDELEEYSKNMENIHFWGFTPYPKMAAVLSKSDVVVNSFIKGAPQSIVNKVGDYLASGKPMINTLENPVFCKLVEENGIGVNIEPGKTDILVDAIKQYIVREFEHGKNARRLAAERFDREKNYKKIVKIVDIIKMLR